MTSRQFLWPIARILAKALTLAAQVPEGVLLAESLQGQPVAICVHGGLSEELAGKHLKKGKRLEV